MRTADGELVQLDAWARVVLQPGETIVSISSAGGGYGPPRERDPERVRHDVAEGWVTAGRAEAVYGVVLTDGSVDEQATRARRAEVSGESPPSPGVEDPVLRLIAPGERLWPAGDASGA
jgi:N-methylhydantoinase B/oxoprolinase/acetone carboxylase alpha subunit